MNWRENTVIEMMAADVCMTMRSLFMWGGMYCMIMTTAELGWAENRQTIAISRPIIIVLSAMHGTLAETIRRDSTGKPRIVGSLEVLQQATKMDEKIKIRKNPNKRFAVVSIQPTSIIPYL